MVRSATDRSEQDSVPEIVLRIPGPWESPEDLRQSLASAKTGYVLNAPDGDGELYLQQQSTGRRFQVTAVEPDDEIADLFADSGRLNEKEFNAIRDHKAKVFVTGPGGSHNAARDFLAIGAAMIKAGGHGVMVDNSGNCHKPQDWLDLAGDKGMGGMYWAFVSVTASPSEVFSAGMHCIGFRDAELLDPVDRKAQGMLMHEFLGYTYQSGVAIVDGDPIGGPEGPEFLLHHHECTRFARGTPWFNPYGIWRLEKFTGDPEKYRTPPGAE